MNELKTEEKEVHDVIDRIVERNRLFMEVVLKDDKPIEERREALERALSVDPFR